MILYQYNSNNSLLGTTENKPYRKQVYFRVICSKLSIFKLNIELNILWIGISRVKLQRWSASKFESESPWRHPIIKCRYVAVTSQETLSCYFIIFFVKLTKEKYVSRTFFVIERTNYIFLGIKLFFLSSHNSLFSYWQLV